jgi:hypothetical protein
LDEQEGDNSNDDVYEFLLSHPGAVISLIPFFSSNNNSDSSIEPPPYSPIPITPLPAYHNKVVMNESEVMSPYTEVKILYGHPGQVE